MHSVAGVVVAQAARKLGSPLMAGEEVVVALDGGSLLQPEYGWQPGSYSVECGDRCEDCAGGAEAAALVLAACGARATVFCQGWSPAAGNTARVPGPHALHRKRVGAQSSHLSTYWAPVVCGLALRQQWVGYELPPLRDGREDLDVDGHCSVLARNGGCAFDCTQRIGDKALQDHGPCAPLLAAEAEIWSHRSLTKGLCWHSLHM